MELKGNLLDFVKLVKAQDDNEAAKSIESYANSRVEKAIKRAWDTSKRFYFKVGKSRNARLRDTRLKYLQESEVISHVDLIDYISSVELCAKELAMKSSDEVCEAIIYVIDEMYARLDDKITIDQRLLFSKRAAEEKSNQ
jgi:nitrogenase molybdenum-iron protein alpha/beta subunit